MVQLYERPDPHPVRSWLIIAAIFLVLLGFAAYKIEFSETEETKRQHRIDQMNQDQRLIDGYQRRQGPTELDLIEERVWGEDCAKPLAEREFIDLIVCENGRWNGDDPWIR